VIVLGLTGSIGMGKSTATRMLRMMGVPVHDSDKAVHAALLPDGSAHQDVAKLFPSALVNGFIDRKKLGAIVFKDKEALKKLESILHPAAQESQQKFVRAMRSKGKRIVVLEIPLLFETGAETRVDYTITVSSPPAIQKRRVLRRAGMTEEKFKSILQSQWPDAEKRALSDFVVDTGLGYARTYRQLQKILKTVKE
jgi:dephospho-CoA kinase